MSEMRLQAEMLRINYKSLNKLQ